MRSLLLSALATLALGVGSASAAVESFDTAEKGLGCFANLCSDIVTAGDYTGLATDVFTLRQADPLGTGVKTNQVVLRGASLVLGRTDGQAFRLFDIMGAFEAFDDNFPEGGRVFLSYFAPGTTDPAGGTFDADKPFRQDVFTVGTNDATALDFDVYHGPIQFVTIGAGSFAGSLSYQLFLSSFDAEAVEAPAPVPVPASGLLLVAGLAGLMSAARLRR